MDSAHSGDPVEGHTLRVVDQELADLRLRTLNLGSLVIDQVSVAVTSLLRAEQSLAEKVLAREPRVNELAREIDRRAFETLALRQLVAGDLRLARAISRIVVELQRASDECRKLARIGIRLHIMPSPDSLALTATLLRHMANVAGAMLRNALRALDEAAGDLAAAVIAQQRDLHDDFSSTLRLLLTHVTAGTPRVAAIIDTVFAAKCLERIGDQAKNMAEQVEYFLSGAPPEPVRASSEVW
jgi:phosphate transport system protein